MRTDGRDNKGEERCARGGDDLAHVVSLLAGGTLLEVLLMATTLCVSHVAALIGMKGEAETALVGAYTRVRGRVPSDETKKKRRGEQGPPKMNHALEHNELNM